VTLIYSEDLFENCGISFNDEKEVIRSVYFEQDKILDGIQKLYCPDGFLCDVTYGNGSFYKNRQQPIYKFDIDPKSNDVVKASSESLPLGNKSIENIVFDPPFLTYVRSGRSGNGNMIMSNRFSGYWTYTELQNHYVASIKEAKRVLKDKGIFVFKCQDIIHNHKMHCTHANVISWCEKENFLLEDLFILPAKHRLPSPNKTGTQKHSRVFHSYFLVVRSK